MIDRRAQAALQTVDDLASHYSEIFKTGNRNAASHLWSSFILERAASLPASTVERLFRGFCPISGSPLPDAPHTRYGASVPNAATGEMISGITHHCCWPCICDTQTATHADTKTVQTADGAKAYTFLVIGNPCVHPEKLDVSFNDFGRPATLREVAPEVMCQGGALVGATLSDHGHPIIGMFFVGDEGTASYTANSVMAGKCEARQSAGYNSGMGAIFQKVAAINTGFPGAVGLYKVEPRLAEGLAPFPVTAALAVEAVIAFVSVGAVAVAGWRWASRRRGGGEDGQSQELVEVLE